MARRPTTNTTRPVLHLRPQVLHKRPAVIATRQRKRGHFYNNTRPVFVVMLLPMLIGIATGTIIITGLYRANLANFGSKRLETPNWTDAKQAMLAAQPDYTRHFTYYKLKDGQDLQDVAAYFSVDPAKLTALNPGTIVPGTTIKLPPVEAPYTPAKPNGQLHNALISNDRGLIRVSNKYRLQQPIVTSIPELAAFTASQDVLQQTGPTTWRLKKPLSLDGDIRLDITPETVTKLDLASMPGTITCLCFDQSAVLIKGVEISTYSPATGQPDTTYADGRSFVRMKNGRMDILNSKFSYLGSAADESEESKRADTNQFVQEGGVYGVSWRISSGTFGTQTTTGWVENSSFEHNHFGAYSFGASGMTWKNSHFANNEIYGLDPHDDSNNALVEGNIFEHNGKHGFIVSKRCNYNIIRNNISVGNTLHGYMLHQDSAYNLIENNVASGNQDNYVIFQSDYDTIRNNKSYAPRSAHIRVNSLAVGTFVTGNQLVGGRRGLYLYDNVNLTYAVGNKFSDVAKNLQTEGAKNTLFAENTIDSLSYKLAKSDTSSMIYGTNTIQASDTKMPNEAGLLQIFKTLRH